MLLLVLAACRGAPRADEQPVPEWLAAEIKNFEDSASANPPELVASYTYQGRLVYYVSPRCCDQYSVVYDSTGAELCAPDGGITGRGDGRCPEFIARRTNEKILWRRPPPPRTATPAADSPETETTVPGRFQGNWAGRQAQCRQPSESSLEITPDSVNFYASRSRVLAVDVIKERVIEILLEPAGNRQFMLSEDGASLTDLTTEGHIVRVRCEPK